MEIVTYVLEGALEHKDSLGNSAMVRSGDVQRISAGTGITHSAYNASQTESVHLLQMWIAPDKTGIAPSYEHRQVLDLDRDWRVVLLASPDGRESSVTLQQDARMYVIVVNAGEVVRHTLAEGRSGYLHIARGAVLLNQQPLQSGDGGSITGETEIMLTSPTRGEALLFDLPG
jgi:redox-sensitive bicupin YhaK (pirin superfamily)